GFHSIFDGVSNVAGLIAVRLAAQPPDAEHPYGHRKYETVFTIAIGLLMLLTCYAIIKEAIGAFSGNHQPNLSLASIVIMLATLFINVFVTTYEKRKGKELDSEFLVADAQHTKSDIYVTSGVLVSLPFVMFGYPLVDPIVGIIVGLFVLRAGVAILRESAETLVDARTGCPVVIEDLAKSVEGVVSCHKIRTRGTASHMFVDLHVQVSPDLSIERAHAIAHAVEKTIKEGAPTVADVIVHIEPAASSGAKGRPSTG
ncbi:MAG TPA: cation diffusion facilitator family transporter, partial [Dissulfurispiraceae bacterium]|nr:cation diffusion facilitator family transporter [Dissulfurispiraceae bacterium]